MTRRYQDPDRRRSLGEKYMSSIRRRVARLRDRSEVSRCTKYLVFGFNFFIWLLGLLIIAVGVWAWTEKDTISNLNKLSDSFSLFDPALLLCIVGGVVFIIAFFGCLGALRENTCLLTVYLMFVMLILLLQVAAGVLIYLYKDMAKSSINDALLDAIKRYRDDADLKNLIDWVQGGWLACCGSKSYKDWSHNVYYKCSNYTLNVDQCSVPKSCCRQKDQNARLDIFCGKDVQNDKKFTQSKVESTIYTRGCLEKGEEWLTSNMTPVAIAVFSIALVQLLGCCLGHSLRKDVLAQRSKQRFNDAQLENRTRRRRQEYEARNRYDVTGYDEEQSHWRSQDRLPRY